MKKILSMILVFLMFLSLCACSDKSSLETENYKPSNEDVLKESEEIDFYTIGEAFDDNKVNAEEAYYGKYYTTVGTVREIEHDEVTIVPLYAIIGKQSYVSTASLCRVKMSNDEIKSLSTHDVIKVCGKLTHFKKSYDSYDLTLEDAFCADNTIEITAKVKDINNYSGGKKSIVLEEFVMKGSSSGYLFYKILVAESGAENSEEAEFMGNTYNIGDEVAFAGVLKNDPDRADNYFDVVDLKTISIIKKSG